MKNYTLSILMLGITISTAVRPQPSPSSLQALDDPEAYKVFAALLPDEWIVTQARAKTLVFQQETATQRGCVPSGGPLERDWAPVLKAFTAANATPKLLRASANFGVPHVVVPSADIRALFKAPSASPTLGWEGFYEKYPDSGGYMVVSAVGFDPPKRRAMAYVAHSCGGLCGGGTYHFLEKVGGVWRRTPLAGIANCMWAS